MYSTLHCNKTKVIWIFCLDIIQVFCESGLIASTYLLLGLLQNNNNISNISPVPNSDKVLSLLNIFNLNYEITSFLILMIIFSLIQSLSKYFCQINIQYLGAWIQERINFDITKIVLDTKFENIASLRTGRLLSIGIESPEAIKNQLEIIACTLISLMLLFVYSQVLITLSFREFIITLIALGLVAALQLLTYKKVKLKSNIVSESKAEVNNLLEEIIRGKKYIKASGAINFAKRKLEKVSKIFRINLFKQALIYELTVPLSKFLGVAIIVAILQIFSNSISNNSILLPTIGVFIVTLQRLIGKITELGQLNNNFNLNKGKIKLYDQLVEVYASKYFFKNKSFRDQSKKIEKTYEKIENIELKNLSFKYPHSKKEVFSRINLKSSKGNIIGIVGRSGSGKSTLLNIISGLIENHDGYYLINGKVKNNLNNFSEAKISIVSQDSFTIHGSIFENIVWDQKPNKNKALECIKQIDNLNFINGLEKGIDTIIGEGGMAISGGQTQLICIARSLYKNSDIFIFDEATNALDDKTEKKVFEKIRKISKDKIIFLVSHDIENIKICDEIYLMKDKFLVRQKDHNELVKNITEK